jgi:sulfur carrier protein ThiS
MAEKKMKVTVEADGETVGPLEFPIGTTVKAILEGSHLRGVARAEAVLVEGKLTPPDTPCQKDSHVEAVKTSGVNG